jgi:hypothetical protein
MAGRENPGLREPGDPNGALLAVCARDAGQELAKIWGAYVKRSPTAAAPIMKGCRPGPNQGREGQLNEC